MSVSLDVTPREVVGVYAPVSPTEIPCRDSYSGIEVFVTAANHTIHETLYVGLYLVYLLLYLPSRDCALQRLGTRLAMLTSAHRHQCHRCPVRG